MTSREMSCELGSDHGGFVLDGVRPSHSSAPVLVENTLLRWWPDTAEELKGFSVATGSQWGPFAVVLRVHEDDPGPLSATWEDVVEVSVEVDGIVMVSEVVDGPVGEIDGVSGSHRMRVGARGRTESSARDSSVDGDGDDTDPIEHYTVDLWPAPPAPHLVVRQDSQYARDQISPPAPVVLPEEEAGLEAAWAIIRDVRGGLGARTIPGGTGTVVIEREFSGTTTKVFNRVQHVFGWPPCRGAMGSADEYAMAYNDATVPGDPDRYETAGFIATRLIERDKPRSVERTWNWVLPGPGSIDQLARLLPDDGVVTVSVTTSHFRGEEPQAIVRLVHTGAPAAWVSDLEHLWAWHLAIWAAH